MSRVFLVPKKDVSIPDPATRRPLPPEGGWVEESPYWTNRLLEEDVTDDSEAQLEREKKADAEALEKAEAEAKGAEAAARKAAKNNPTEA